MDGTIIIATAMILAIAILIALLKLSMKIKHQNQEKRLLACVSEFERTNNIRINTADLFRQKFIGTDDERNYLLFIDGSDTLPNTIKIELPEVKKAEITARSSKTGKTSLLTSLNEHTVAFYLTVSFATKEVVVLPFYNEVQDGVGERDHLLALVKKWAGLINSAHSIAV